MTWPLRRAVRPEFTGYFCPGALAHRILSHLGLPTDVPALPAQELHPNSNSPITTRICFFPATSLSGEPEGYACPLTRGITWDSATGPRANGRTPPCPPTRRGGRRKTPAPCDGHQTPVSRRRGCVDSR